MPLLNIVPQKVREFFGGQTEAERWIDSGDWQAFSSSNVDLARYDKAEGRLWVQYKDGAVWSYAVNDAEAAWFHRAPSKGRWLWDNVRIRGTREHRVDARLEYLH